MNGLRRFQSFWFVGSAILSAVLVWIPLRDIIGRRLLIGLPIALGSLALLLLSGHRTALIETVMTVFFLSLFQRYWTPTRLLGFCFIFTAAATALYLTASHLPLAIQRSISFVPGIEVTSLARDDAVNTLTDRIDVLKLAIKDVPQYWLAGRGFGMERFDILPSDGFYSGAMQGYINGFFYNGLIGSVLKTGAIGFICMLSFVFYISKMAGEVVGLIRLRGHERWSTFDRLGLLICAQWFSVVLFFYFLHGDAGVWAQIIALQAALIVAWRRQLIGEELAEEEHAESVGLEQYPETLTTEAR
jgi:hypothetical protein